MSARMSDRWWAYDYLDPEQRQLCWAHLVRDFTAHSEGLAAQKAFGEAGLALAERLFAAWDEYRRDGIRTRLIEQVEPLKHKLRPLLEQAARKSTKTNYHRLFAKNLLKRWPALRTFTEIDGVEPTNNHAERGRDRPGTVIGAANLARATSWWRREPRCFYYFPCCAHPGCRWCGHGWPHARGTAGARRLPRR